MAEVWIPVAMRNLTGGRDRIRVAGSTIRQIIDNLDEEHPGIKRVLCHDGEVMPGIAVVVDGETTNMGLLEWVEEDSEVHFLPAIGGGAGCTSAQSQKYVAIPTYPSTNALGGSDLPPSGGQDAGGVLSARQCYQQC